MSLNNTKINTRQLKTLLVVYFKQDFRSGRSFLRNDAKEFATSNLALLSMLGMYIFVGFSTAIFAFAGADIFLYSVVALSVTLLLVALAIVAESSNVIFNETEPDIIGHLPVNSTTLFAAKVLNLFFFTLLLAIAANLLPTLAGVWAKDSNYLFPIAHLVSAIFTALFATTLVMTSYGLLMRYISKERFNNFIAYAQTGLSMFLILGYQVLPRLMDKDRLAVPPSSRKFLLLYPPAWFSGLTLVLMGKVNWFSLTLAALALISLAFFSVLALRKVAAGYSSFVSQLAYDANTTTGKKKPDATVVAGKAVTQKPASVMEACKPFFLRTPVERASFDLVATYLKRDREIKVRLYPSFAYLILFPLLGLFTGGLADPFLNQTFIFNSLAGAAMIPFVASVAAETCLFTEHYQAAYIFRVAPIANLGHLHSGLRKAAQVYVALPGALILLILYTFLWKSLLHAFLLLVPWLILTPAVMMFSFIRREFLPLSRKYRKGQQSARFMILFFASFLCILVVGTVQGLGMRGVIPYWLFIIGTFIFSAILYFALRLISGERRPLVAVETLNE
jgi:ABC-2 type transport system permease protein